MKAHDKLPSLDEIKAYARSMRWKEQASELKITEDMEALQAAKLEKLHTENEQLRTELDCAYKIKHAVVELKEAQIDLLNKTLDAKQEEIDSLKAKLEAAELEASEVQRALLGAIICVSAEPQAVAQAMVEAARYKAETEHLKQLILDWKIALNTTDFAAEILVENGWNIILDGKELKR